MIRRAGPEDAERLLTLARRFAATTHYHRIAPATDEALTSLIGICLAMGVIFVDELEHANDCATWFDALSRDHFPPAGVPPCNCGRGIVGLIAIVALPHMLTGRAYADEVAWWVEPEHRTTRAGYRLLRAAIEWTRQNGLSVLKMVAPPGTTVGAFYEGLGFELVESAYQLVITD